ncbi:MAG: hypothetical protein JXR36_10890 [Bacteroidales bacterium]|nr:hypothetical protein [Bacteroidales bacterium]
MISPLNWGLGHASRIIPIIRTLISMGHEVKIGGSGTSVEYLHRYFSDEDFITISSPTIKYGKKQAIGAGFAISFFSFTKGILHDKRVLKKIIQDHKFDVVISDNRPGLFSNDIKSIYITHQFNVLTRKPRSLSGRLVRLAHRKLLDKFDYCLIPDNYGAQSMAGLLARAELNQKNHYIGVLSRFSEMKLAENVHNVKKADVLVLFSGPEPQRTSFERIVIDKFRNSDKKIAIVRGVLNKSEQNEIFPNNMIVYNNPDDNELFYLIKTTPVIICRSGYSSLMDLAACNRKAVLVPTPGQPEQEYLAENFVSRFGFVACQQNEIAILNIEHIEPNSYWDYPYDSENLKKVLDLCLK